MNRNKDRDFKPGDYVRAFGGVGQIIRRGTKPDTALVHWYVRPKIYRSYLPIAEWEIKHLTKIPLEEVLLMKMEGKIDP